MKIEYLVVEMAHRDLFEKQINELIEEGWQPQGGIAIAFQDRTDDIKYKGYKGRNPETLYIQAMVKYEDRNN